MFAPVSGSAETSTDLPFGAVILTDTNSNGAVTVDPDTEEIQADFTPGSEDAADSTLDYTFVLQHLDR